MAGAYTRARVPLPRATPGNNQRHRVNVTFSTNSTWVAPVGTRAIARMVGKGTDGRPATGAHDYHYGYRRYQTLHYKQNGGPEQTTAETDQGWFEELPVPSNFCSSHAFDGPDLEYWYCYRHVAETHDDGDYVGATAGSTATGFGKTFPGGPSAQPAAVTSFLNVAIIPETSYSVVVPTGGYITIEY